MDLLTTILTCSLYASDDAVVRAIAEGPGEANAFLVVSAVADATQVMGSAPHTETDALRRVVDLGAKGGRPLLGLLGVPPAWIEAFGRPLASAFDPCTNIAIGSAMLSEFDYECASPPSGADERARALERTNRRACVLRKYEAATGAEDFAHAVQLELSAQRTATARVEDAPIFAPAVPTHWGPDQLLVPVSALAALTPVPRP
jgi:hypothetical protein